MADDQSNRPVRKEPRIPMHPRIRQIYWCDMPKDSIVPEMWKCRPVVILSKGSSKYGKAMVIPITTQRPKHSELSFHMTTNYGIDSWALCDHIMTVSCARLKPGKDGKVLRMPENEFRDMMRVVLSCLPGVEEDPVPANDTEFFAPKGSFTILR